MSRTIAQPLSNQQPNIAQPMTHLKAINAGEATTFRLHQIGNCNNMMVIHVEPPASPLHNIDKPLTNMVDHITNPHHGPSWPAPLKRRCWVE